MKPSDFEFGLCAIALDLGYGHSEIERDNDFGWRERQIKTIGKADDEDESNARGTTNVSNSRSEDETGYVSVKATTTIVETVNEDNDGESIVEKEDLENKFNSN